MFSESQMHVAEPASAEVPRIRAAGFRAAGRRRSVSSCRSAPSSRSRRRLDVVAAGPRRHAADVHDDLRSVREQRGIPLEQRREIARQIDRLLDALRPTARAAPRRPSRDRSACRAQYSGACTTNPNGLRPPWYAAAPASRSRSLTWNSTNRMPSGTNALLRAARSRGSARRCPTARRRRSRSPRRPATASSMSDWRNISSRATARDSRRPTSLSTNCGDSPSPGLLLVSMSRAIGVCAGMSVAATRLLPSTRRLSVSPRVIQRCGTPSDSSTSRIARTCSANCAGSRLAL